MEIDQNCNGVDEGNEDSDGDGTTSCAGDCDDSDAFVNSPDIDGVCGADADSDGYVAIADGGTDCDDSTGTVNPGQVERSMMVSIMTVMEMTFLYLLAKVGKRHLSLVTWLLKIMHTPIDILDQAVL